MTAGLIAQSNVWCGKTTSAGKNNVRGFYENLALRKFINGTLEELGYDPFGQAPLPPENLDINLLPSAPEIKDKVCDVLENEGYKGGPWLLKNAKLALIWPAWHAAFPTAKWVLVQRDPVDIAQSCLRTSFMNSYETAQEWEAYARDYHTRMNRMKTAGLDCFEINTDKIISGEDEEYKEMMRWLALDYDKKSFQKFVLPKAWGNDQKPMTWQRVIGAVKRSLDWF